MTGRALTRIMLVEDEEDIQTVAKLALEAIGGFTVETCSSGKQALAAAPTFAPDLILLDVMMPDLTGPSTLQAMRANPELEKIPVIFMTAKVQSHEVSEYRAMGALGVIPKPFDPLTLANLIRQIWNEAHAAPH